MMICIQMSGMNLSQTTYYAVVFVGYLSASRQMPGEYLN
jgi:hypothetical protein